MGTGATTSRSDAAEEVQFVVCSTAAGCGAKECFAKPPNPPRQSFRLNVWNTFQPHTSHLADRLTGSAKSDPVLPGSRTRTSPLQPLHFINIDITHHQSPITQHAHSRPLQEQGRKGPAPRCCPSVAQSQHHANVKKLSVERCRAYSVTLPADVPQPTCDTVQHACR